MVEAIEQPWWANEREIAKTTAKVCRDIGKKTENNKARITAPSYTERKKNIDDIHLLLNKLMIN